MTVLAAPLEYMLRASRAELVNRGVFFRFIGKQEFKRKQKVICDMRMIRNMASFKWSEAEH